MTWNLNHHHYIHLDPDSAGLLREMNRKLDLIINLDQRMETEMALDFSKMVAAATKQQGVTNSVLQFTQDSAKALSDISAQLAAAIAANDPAAMTAAQTQIDALAQGFDDNDDKIAAAIAAPGTPGTPPPAAAP